MRLYRVGSDDILVDDMTNRGNYITLERYLTTIPEEADKRIEKESIKKVVDWYK